MGAGLSHQQKVVRGSWSAAGVVAVAVALWIRRKLWRAAIGSKPADSQPPSPLCVAAKANDAEQVASLLSAGEDPDQRDRHGEM
eukprot:SAG22_NODE_153_length_17315_cov_69.981935_5_plen_84_part_00